jgi:NADH dehydrogenase
LGVPSRNPATQEVITREGPLSYWRLIWALGAQPDFQPQRRQVLGLSPELAIAPYNTGQACRLRRQIGGYLAQAATLSPTERQPLLTVVISGGSFVGTEIAGQLADRLAGLSKHHQIPDKEIRLVLVEPCSRLFADFDERLGQAAGRILSVKGVSLRFGVGLAVIYPDHVLLSDGTRIDTHTVVWAGGVRLVHRHWHSTLLPLIAPQRVDRYRGWPGMCLL